ncbi:Flp pilus assembly protein CpaB [Achromobacter sp. UMC71]|uniref:Flp pilus assembly protein CpaB n=1 Tax=Achromobacter sp. UMC71 TaxID=1862320 RepID=UPI00210287C3|nr:Flp pilus assembly protein CpaB [Achromobacter sp. UMC71]MBB1624944.1 Flp pilus assembly protein CpaB [Achromobacter sp. UMC71]
MMGLFTQGLRRLRKAAVYLLALAAGLMSAWAVREHVQQRVQALEAQARTPVVSRLVAAYDLPAGTVLDESHLAVREIPAQWAPATSVDPLGIDGVLGARLSADLAGGEPVLKAYLTFIAPAPALASRLKPGQRAFMVAAADLGGLADMLRAGDAIDIYVSFSHRDREVTVPLLQGMRVLTAADASDGDGTANITLAASPDEAMRYIAARQAGTLTAMLRNRDDAAAVSAAPQSDLASLIGLDREPRRKPGVVILYGDRLGGQDGAPGTALAGFETERP